MNIYLDIDGTMIHEGLSTLSGQPAVGLEGFIIALRPYDTYWLTTHCTTGDPTNARQIMKAVLPSDLHADIDRIKPTVWQDMKTNAIDFSSEFVWFDNDVFASEWEVLKQCKDNQMVIEVDLNNNPRQLVEITRDVLNDF